VKTPQRGSFVSEPAILVKRKGYGSQVWSMEKLENKLIDMRELYEESKSIPIKVTSISLTCREVLICFVRRMDLLEI
jgi:Kinesin protein 1B